MRRVDAHHHLWDLEKVSYPWLMARGQERFFGDPSPIQRNYPVSEFRAGAEAFAIEASVHIQVGASDPKTEANWIQSVADDNPMWPAAQVAFCDLASENAEADLESLSKLPTVRGIRQIVGRSAKEDSATGTNRLLEDPKFEMGLRTVADLGLSFDLQLIPELMQRSAELFARIEDLPVALCHCGSPGDWSASGLRSWARSLRDIAALPQFHCKLSGLGMFRTGWTTEDIRPIVETCLELFGSERCMFGSNFPVDSLRSNYGAIVSAYENIVPPGDHDAVFGGNAAQFYRI